MTDPFKPTDPETPIVEGAAAPADWEPTEAVPAAAAAHLLADLDDRYLRLAAEYENYRKRTHKEKTEAFDRGASALISRLLEVLDDIDRLAASDASTPAEAFRAAFELTQKKLRKELEAAGLERLDPAGQPFDPNEHDAVAVAPLENPSQDHTVKATFQTGYRFKGTVVRPARVQVYSDSASA